MAGVTGYAGAELARLLLGHPKLQAQAPLLLGRMDAESAAANAQPTQTLYDLHPHLARNDGKPAPAIVPFTWERLRDSGTEVLLLATPHEQSREWVPQAIASGLRVIDLSGAWRLHDPANAAVYKLRDDDPETAAALQNEAVYGCPELHRDQIRHARLVANPGCYATSIILALAPLLRAAVVDLQRGIVCDSKSGVSGAGKAPTAKTHFMSAADNLSAYSVFGHRHTGELLEQLDLAPRQIRFTPHLLPIPRGILSTIYLRLNCWLEPRELQGLFDMYRHSPMVRVHGGGHLPQIHDVVRTNFCDIGFKAGPDNMDVVIVSCLDNLLKGAAGQAIQNLNVMCGWNEEEGLL